MKKRFPAILLALVLCLGLAVPAFAADEDTSAALYTYISPASGEEFPYVNWDLEYKWRNLDANKAYTEAEDGKGNFMVVPTHEYFSVGVYNLAEGEESTLKMTAYTDHDGDGVYDTRLFAPKVNAEGDVEIPALPIPESGKYDAGIAFDIAVPKQVPGFTQVGKGNYAFSAAGLHELFGDNTLLFFFLGDDNEFLGGVWLKAGPFDDVPGIGWYSDHVAWAAEKGITTGTDGNDFSPADACTHIQILTFLSRAAGNTKAGATDWAEEQMAVIEWAQEQGMIGEGFDAQKPCTRAEAVNYIWQAKDKPEAQPSTFKDMDGYEQYAKAVDWAYEANVTRGSGNGIFDPGSVCNRAYIVTFLSRAYNG